jgi:hypothetical protein
MLDFENVLGAVVQWSTAKVSSMSRSQMQVQTLPAPPILPDSAGDLTEPQIKITAHSTTV